MIPLLLCLFILSAPDVVVDGNVVYVKGEDGIVYAYKSESISQDPPFITNENYEP